jgi:hypothetical protein
LHWFETELLTQEENLIGLMALNRETLGQAESFDGSDSVVLDMDSSESPVHGEQEGSAYNGHFESVCYHPLFLFNSHGDCLAAKLRSGNVHSAEDWGELFPRVGFIVTNLSLPNRAVIRFYTCWPTTWATCGVAWCCQRESMLGR